MSRRSTAAPDRGRPDRERDERIALLRLSAIPGVGIRRLRRAVREAGTALALVERGPAGLGAALGIAPTHAGPVGPAEALLDGCAARGVAVVGWGEDRYPPRLHHLTDPPPVLYVVGDPFHLHERQVAIVGSRRATSYGRRVARRLAGELAGAGVTVLSGMALGIDGEAHVGALTAGGRSTAVLGSGPERAQPRSHARLHRRLCEAGAVASEHPPGTPALGHHFPARNRLLAALAAAVLVVEAAEKSGALITVREATALGRDVLAVPGPIDAPTSRGTNALIRDGATPILDTGSLLAAVGVGDDAVQTSLPVAPPADLGPDAVAAWSALSSRAVGVDELARAARLEAPRALAALARLELEGWALQDEAFRFRRRGA